MTKNTYNCETNHFLCQSSAIFAAYFSPLIGHDARIPFRHSNTLGIIQASLASVLAQWSFLPLRVKKSTRKADEILTNK